MATQTMIFEYTTDISSERHEDDMRILSGLIGDRWEVLSPPYIVKIENDAPLAQMLLAKE